MMRLHQERTAFQVLIEQIHDKTGYRSDVLEKDYYVVLMLYELADKQANGLQAYFKGGTALYKALRTTNRFSEDIDLSVDTRECSRTQNDRRLEQATKKYGALVRDPSLGRTNKSEVIAVYTYDPITAYDQNDALQRFGRVKIEATSFTISEPVESLEISPMLYELADESQRAILETQYGVVPFSIQTITMERIFVDKLFAAEAYVRRSDDAHRAFEAAKHIYDLSVIADHPKITRLLTDREQMKHLLDIRMEEERSRLDGIPGVPSHEFTFFEKAAQNAAVRKAYETMQNQYVLRDQDRIEYDAAVLALNRLRERLSLNPAWSEYDAGTREKDRPSVLAKPQQGEIEAQMAKHPAKPKKRKDLLER